MKKKLFDQTWFWGILVFLGFTFIVGILIYKDEAPWIPDQNKVCTYNGCYDAGSPAEAQRIIHVTETARPVITTYGDITIQRFYDSATGRFIYVCSNRQTDQTIPCSIQGEK